MFFSEIEDNHFYFLPDDIAMIQQRYNSKTPVRGDYVHLYIAAFTTVYAGLVVFHVGMIRHQGDLH